MSSRCNGTHPFGRCYFIFWPPDGYNINSVEKLWATHLFTSVLFRKREASDLFFYSLLPNTCHLVLTFIVSSRATCRYIITLDSTSCSRVHIVVWINPQLLSCTFCNQSGISWASSLDFESLDVHRPHPSLSQQNRPRVLFFYSVHISKHS